MEDSESEKLCAHLVLILIIGCSHPHHHHQSQSSSSSSFIVIILVILVVGVVVIIIILIIVVIGHSHPCLFLAAAFLCEAYSTIFSQSQVSTCSAPREGGLFKVCFQFCGSLIWHTCMPQWYYPSNSCQAWRSSQGPQKTHFSWLQLSVPAGSRFGGNLLWVLPV